MSGMQDKRAPKVGGWYAHYVLFVLMIVYIFNFIDRQILAILAHDIQLDLGISDSQMGFLYGTVFALFYAIFGIPMGRFADVWVRRSLISLGLFFWSAMTVLSGFAKSFPVLAILRTGVGIGEASASPSAYSMLSDYYSPKVRATVIALYSSGLYIGAGIGLYLGGFILDSWKEAYPVAADAPFGLKGWQVAFMMVGFPGIIMALWVRTLKEPVRGRSEGLETKPHPAPFSVLLEELSSLIPVWSLVTLSRYGASVRNNLIAAIVIAAASSALIHWTESVAQWLAMGVGVYIIFGWMQSIAVRDPATFSMIFKSRGMLANLVGFGFLNFVAFGVGFWITILLIRVHDIDISKVGEIVGLCIAFGGLTGVTLGGMIADWLRRKYAAGRMYVALFATLAFIPTVLACVYADTLVMMSSSYFAICVIASCWVSIPPTTATDLVMPRMRAVAGALYLLTATFIGLALGPYAVGEASDYFAGAGLSSDVALRHAMALTLTVIPISFLALALACKYVPEDEASRISRAKALGEDISAGG